MCLFFYDVAVIFVDVSACVLPVHFLCVLYCVRFGMVCLCCANVPKVCSYQSVYVCHQVGLVLVLEAAYLFSLD